MYDFLFEHFEHFESNIDRASESARLELEIFDRAMAPARLDSSNKDFLFDSSRTSSMLDRRAKSDLSDIGFFFTNENSSVPRS